MLETENINNYLLHASYLGIFIWFVLLDQLTPIPEEVVLISMGYICGHNHHLNPFIAGAAAILGMVIFDNVFFYLGMKGSKLALRFQHKMSVSMREKIQKGLQKNKFVTLMIMLFVPKLRFFAPAVAAVMKINYKLFLFVDLLAVLLYVALYMAIGWLFHDQLNRVLNKMHMLQHFIFIGLMVVLAIFLMWKVIKAFTEKHFHKKKKPASK